MGLQRVPRPWFPSDFGFHVMVIVTVTAGDVNGFGASCTRRSAASQLQAVRDNEQRAQSLGYNTFRVKFEAFVIMGGVVGLAGGLLALMLHGAYADNLGWQHAGDSLLMTVLGACIISSGPLWGAIAFILMEDRLSAITESWWLMFRAGRDRLRAGARAAERMQGLVFPVDGTHGLDAGAPFCAASAGEHRLVRGRRGGHGDPAKPVLEVRGLNKRFGSLVVAQVHSPGCASVYAAQPDWPERRRKDHVLQYADRVIESRCGIDPTETVRNSPPFPSTGASDLGLSRSFQVRSVFPFLTTFESTSVSRCRRAANSEHALWRDAHTGLKTINARTWSLLHDVGGLDERAAEPCANLSHGEKRSCWKSRFRWAARMRSCYYWTSLWRDFSAGSRPGGGRRADPTAGENASRCC